GHHVVIESPASRPWKRQTRALQSMIRIHQPRTDQGGLGMRIKIVAKFRGHAAFKNHITVAQQYVFRGAGADGSIGGCAVAKIPVALDDRHSRKLPVHHRDAAVGRRIIEYYDWSKIPAQAFKARLQLVSSVVVDDDNRNRRTTHGASRHGITDPYS